MSSQITSYKEKTFEIAYSNIDKIEVIATIESCIQETEHGIKFKIKILDSQNKQIKKTKLIAISDKNTELEYGDIIKITGEYQDIVSYKNKGVFNYKESLKKENIYGKIKIEKIEKVGKLNNPYKIFIQINESIKSKIDRCFQKEYGGVLKALIIGDKSNLSSETKNNFQNNGLSHILAISGMHISLILLISQKVIQKISNYNRKNKKILVSILIFYCLIIGFIPSAIRAVIMSILAICSKLFYRKNNSLTDICIAILFILIYNPYYLIDSGFLLSFGATIGIIYVFPRINKIKFKSKILKYIFETFMVSLAVNIAIFPIVIYFFKRISISFFITGIIITPLVFAIEILGIIFIFVPSNLASIVVYLINLTMAIFLQIAKINLGGLYFKVPNLISIAIYYLVLMYLMKFISTKLIKNILKRAIIILAIISMIITFRQNNRDYLKIKFIDVGQGDATLIITPGNKNILIDGGGSEDYDIGKNVLVPYLLSNKVNKLHYIIVSHFDSDHVRTAY